MLYGDRIRQLDFAIKKVIPISGRRLTVGLDLYNVMNNNVTLGVQPDVRSQRSWVAESNFVYEPARLPFERGIRLLDFTA